MLPIPRQDGIACKNCPFFGAEGIVAEVPRPRHRHPENAHLKMGTCRVERPDRVTGQLELADQQSALCGEIRVGGHLWVPEDYWCGRHPKIRCPNECSARPPKPKATHIAFGKASTEPDPSHPKGT